MRTAPIEHVFGTLKYGMGSTHFLMKKMDHVERACKKSWREADITFWFGPVFRRTAH
jgi:hypothetical protein